MKTARRRGRNGFALVVTISLMVLLALMAVGLLSLSTIALRGSDSKNHQAQARANARLALTLAIGQLQAAAGPDQRITTTADQLADTGGDGGESAAVADRRHWTGVYEAWPAGSTTRPDPRFVSWLVSGDSRKATSRSTPKSTAGDGIELVGPGTLGKLDDGRVTVEPVPVADARGGSPRLAWWTGDQGVKVAIESPANSRGDDPVEVRTGLQDARRPAITLAKTVNGALPFEGLADGDDRRSLVTGWEQTAFIAADRQTFRGLFHDLAANSSGMLINVRSGGFRKDLSMFLERRANQAPSDPLYRVAGMNGINFSELWLHYNVYKELETRKTLRFTTGGSGSRGAPYLEIKSSQQALLQDHANFYKQPSVISYKTVLSFHSRTVQSGGREKQRLAVVVDPIVTFWNPLDVPVSLEPAYNSIKFWQIPYDIILTVGGKTIRTSLRRALARTQWHYLTLITGKREPIILKPGEVLVYSQAANTAIQRFNPGLNFVDGKAGWNLGGGVAVDLLDTGNSFIDLEPNDTLRYRLEPNRETSLGTRHWFLTGYSLYYKEDRAQRGESVGLGGSTIDYIYGEPYSSSSPKPDASRLTATGFPEVFRTPSRDEIRPLTIGQLRDRKEPFLLYTHNAKTEFGTDTGGRWLARQNPKAHRHDFPSLASSELDLMPFEIQVEPLNSWKNRNLEVSPDGNGFFAGGMNAEFGSSFLITHAVPREPLYSLAGFQHAFANGFPSNTASAGYAIINTTAPMLPEICHPIGNSFAPSVLPPDQTDGTDRAGRILADHSWLANQALWDDWFLSGIAPQDTPRHPDSRSQQQVARDFLDGSSPLPVTRYRPAVPESESERLLDLWFDGNRPSADAHLLTAQALRVNGLFNINSTSVEAWKALLGVLREHPVPTQDEVGRESISPTEEGTSAVANLIASHDLIASGDGNVDVKDPAQWVGRRSLSDEEIEALARALVREVRKRGPFLSLADFVNRRVGRDKALAVAGAVQSALDSPEAGINAAYHEGGRGVPDAVAGRFPFPDAESGPAAYGAPGLVKQADILTPIAPLLAARSDSFIIRTYGESVSGGKIVARAWCEAVVERQADFIDSADEPNSAADELSREVNRKFGRRFVVTAFRWLNPQEI